MCTATSAQPRSSSISIDQLNRDIWGYRSKWIQHLEDPIDLTERPSLSGARATMPTRVAGTPQWSVRVSHSLLRLQTWRCSHWWDRCEEPKDRRAVEDARVREWLLESLLQKLHRVHQRARDKCFCPGMPEQIRRRILACLCRCIFDYHTGYPWVQPFKNVNQEAATVIQHFQRHFHFQTIHNTSGFLEFCSKFNIICKPVTPLSVGNGRCEMLLRGSRGYLRSPTKKKHQ